MVHVLEFEVADVRRVAALEINFARMIRIKCVRRSVRLESADLSKFTKNTIVCDVSSNYEGC